MLRRAPQGHERIMSERSTQRALGVGCPHRNNGHSDGSDREFGAASLAKAKGWSANGDDSTLIEKVA